MSTNKSSVQQPRPDVGDLRSPKSAVGSVTLLPVAHITADLGIQMRAEMDQRLRADYAETLRAHGWVFPPVVIYHDGHERLLSEGFHRYAAALDEGLTEISAEVRPGTHRDALLNACGANATHGLRRSAGDKRRAVRTLLGDTEWGQASSAWIAEKCRVSVNLVCTIREEAISLCKKESEVNTRREPTLSESDRGNAVEGNQTLAAEGASLSEPDSAIALHRNDTPRRKWTSTFLFGK